jgi:ribosomal protein L40E
MTKKTVGYVHLEWECPACGTRNKGTNKFCRNCGAVQPKDVKFEQVVQPELIEDEQIIAQAKAGPDIICSYCGASNPATSTYCSQCGANLSEGTARESGDIIGAFKQEPVSDIICPYCGTSNPGTALNCSNCGAVLPRPDQPVPPEAEEKRPSAPMSGTARFVLLAVVGLFVVGCIALLVFSSRTEDVVGQVQDVSWEYSVAIEALVPVQDEDWQDRIPNDAEILSCREEVRRVEQFPAPNSVEVCGEPYTVDTGSGIGEVVQDCEYQVYDNVCRFTALAWQEVDLVSAVGNDFAPEWPNPRLAQDQRFGESREFYEVVFAVDGRSYTYQPNSLDEFSRFEYDDRWILQVNGFDNIVSLQPDR